MALGFHSAAGEEVRQSSSGDSDQYTCLDFANQPAVTRWHKPATFLFPLKFYLVIYFVHLCHTRDSSRGGKATGV